MPSAFRHFQKPVTASRDSAPQIAKRTPQVALAIMQRAERSAF